MNVIELRDDLVKVQKTARKLPDLALGGLDIALKVDRQWNVTTEIGPVRRESKGRGVIRYENLWTRVTPEMAGRVSGRIEAIRLTLEGRLLQAAASIQKDLLATDFGGIVAFWRHKKSWLRPQLHSSHWCGGNKVVFVDAYLHGGMFIPFICRDNLDEMPSDYQAGFISRVWPHASVLIEKCAIYSDDPPPEVDIDGMEEKVYYS